MRRFVLAHASGFDERLRRFVLAHASGFDERLRRFTSYHSRWASLAIRVAATESWVYLGGAYPRGGRA